MLKNLVIIPTYNEKGNIKNIINAVYELPVKFDVLIVDDGSPDGTAEIVKSMQKEDSSRLHLIEREGKLGLGTAYIRGFRFGLQHNYDYICEMDADFSHSPKDLPKLLETCQNGADVAIGSRYVKGGGTRNWPKDRLILSKGASFYVQLITRMPIKDPTAGFVCYSDDVLRKIDLDKIEFIGYAFQIEMKFAARSLGFKIVEVPIIFSERTEGQSKMTKGIIMEGVVGVVKMKMKSFTSHYGHQEKKEVS